MLESYGLTATVAEPPDLGDTATAVLGQIREGPIGADELSRATGLTAGTLAVALTELELTGVVSEENGVYRAAS